MAARAALQRTESGDAYTLTSARREAIAGTATLTNPDAVRAEFERLPDETDPAISPNEVYSSAIKETAA